MADVNLYLRELVYKVFTTKCTYIFFSKNMLKNFHIHTGSLTKQGAYPRSEKECYQLLQTFYRFILSSNFFNQKPCHHTSVRHFSSFLSKTNWSDTANPSKLSDIYIFFKLKYFFKEQLVGSLFQRQ